MKRGINAHNPSYPQRTQATNEKIRPDNPIAETR